MITQQQVDNLNKVQVLIRLQLDFNPFMLEESLINWWFEQFRKTLTDHFKKSQKDADAYLAYLRVMVETNGIGIKNKNLEAQFRHECYVLAVDKIHDSLF